MNKTDNIIWQVGQQGWAIENHVCRGKVKHFSLFSKQSLWVRMTFLGLSLGCAVTPIWATSLLIGGGSQVTYSATGISADGSVVVGNSIGSDAFRWTQSGDIVGLDDLAGGRFDSSALDVNADGTVVVGAGNRSNSGNDYEAFRWTKSDGMVGLGDLAGGIFNSGATGVSADGSVVVGYGSSTNSYEAFRWTQAEGMVRLGSYANLSGDILGSAAYGVSADGLVVVGQVGIASNDYEAFRWTQAEGMIGLGDLAGGSLASRANAANSDGSVVVGEGEGINGTEAFRWTQSGGMVGLGDLSGSYFDSRAYDVNADGSVVVGQGHGINGTEAFRWTQADGMISVADWLATNSVNTDGFYILNTAESVSADGNTVVGRGASASGYEAYIAHVNSATSGIVGLIDLSRSLTQSFATSHQMEGLVSLTMNGAHHRLLTDMAVGHDGHCAWVSGDAGRLYRSANGYTGMAEVGLCHDFSDQGLRVGTGIGESLANLDLANDGNSHVNGQYGVVELDWQIPNQPVMASMLAIYGKWDADLKRGYAIAGTQPSKGETDVTAYSMRARLDWHNAFHVGPISVSPRMAYTATRTKIDAYQEVGGSAPVRFDEQKHTAKELRVGLTGRYILSDKVTLLGHAEAVHRFDARGDNIQGNINIFGTEKGFNQAGNKVRKDWGRVGAEIDYQLSEHSVLNANSFVSSAGNDPDITAALSYRFAF